MVSPAGHTIPDTGQENMEAEMAEGQGERTIQSLLVALLALSAC